MTAKQIKDLIRNQAKKNNIDAQILLRNYMLERLCPASIRLDRQDMV